ncbi:MAG: hypothetical protein GXZ08_08830 [Tissierellia bacterium]|nr:hypothetical protein [Tissierellia bacterium]
MKNSKKIFMLLLVMILTFSLVACGKGEGGNAGGGTKLSPEEIIDKQMAASESMESGKMKMNLTMEMTAEGEESFTIESVTDTEFTMDPLVMKMEMSMGIEGESMTTLMYLDKDDMHVQIPGTDMWQTIPAEMSGMNIEETLESYSTEEISQILKEHIKDVKIEEVDNHYIINYSGNGDMLKELVAQMMNSTFPEDGIEELEDLDITEFTYTNKIDKNTFLPVYSEANFKMTVTSEGQKVDINQTQIMEFLEINSIDEIVLPEM